ncbi:P-loop containing nucleoside triphosphate hydrolase protein [Nemania sp. NC0429]|nr:P-loop containing nucleoside triphosphate hydrolase protein [Nemania sp. NC0429]
MITPSLLAWCLGTRARTPLYGMKLPIRRLFRASPSHFTLRCYGIHRPRGRTPSFIPSDEQKEIIRLCSVQNVVVSARPGSGKTATAEAIVAAYPDKRVGVLTYSKQLQRETYRRLRNYSNSEVLTFHGMATLLFDTVVHNDAILSGLRETVFRCNELPRWRSALWDIIVLDEFQDCTPLLFWLINYFILANTPREGGQPPRLVVLGDERQAIYQFRGADQRYITLAPELLAAISPYPFAKLTLSNSFRLSKETSEFVNKAFLGGDSYITSEKSGPKPIVLRHNHLNDYAVAQKLSTLIKYYGSQHSAVLAPYVRHNVSLQKKINILAEKYHIPIAVPMDDDGPLDDRVINGKMCVSTIHQFKGRERDLVLLFGMDSSFFKYVGRSLPVDRCPNEVFVALTRAKEQLVLIFEEDHSLMPFVPAEAVYATADVVNLESVGGKIAPSDRPDRPPAVGLNLPSMNGVRDVTRHARSEDLNEIIKRHLCIRQLSPPLPKEEHLDIPDVVPSDLKRKWFHEAVSDINGLVVVAAIEYDLTKKMSMLDLDECYLDTLSSTWSKEQISCVSRHACAYEARHSGYKPRAIQMENHKFDWIKPADLGLAISRLQAELRNVSSSIKFEVHVDHDFGIGNQKIKLGGRADIVSYNNRNLHYDDKDDDVESVWEIKFVSQLSHEHIVQACIYAYMLSSRSGGLPRIILYNVRDGEKQEIVPRDGREGLRRMIESVLRLKWTVVRGQSDEEFIKSCAEITARVNSLDRSW